MKYFFYHLLDPLVVCWILIATAVGLAVFKKVKLSRRLIWAAIIGMFIASCTPVGPLMIYTLEKKYNALALTSRVSSVSTHILILGGGHYLTPELPASGQLSSTALSRLTEGIRIYHQLNGSKLICSGYSSSGRKTQSEITADAALELGVVPSDTLQIRWPGNTAEEIEAYKKRFGTKYTLLVVTSAYHMGRAMIYCKKAGLNGIPAPTDFYIKKDWSAIILDFKPSDKKIEMLKIALHEYGGYIKTEMADWW